MIKKILLQLSNFMMLIIVLYVRNTFFVHTEMNFAHLAFSRIAIVVCLLSLFLFIASVISKIKVIDEIVPYDSFLIFIAFIGSLVTAIPFFL